MADRLEMSRRMLAGRVVAAAHMSALLADAEVDLVVPPGGHALDATSSGWGHVVNLIEMLADVAHGDLLAARAADAVAGWSNVVSSVSHPISAAAPSYEVARNARMALRGSGEASTASYGKRNSPAFELHAASGGSTVTASIPAGAGNA